MKKFLIFIILVSLSLSVFSQEKKAPDKPKLIVGIVIDQMRYDYIYRYWDKFGENGFKKLVNTGSFCKNTNYNYLLNHSSSAYATIATGTTPSNHGIISDSWYLRLKNTNQYCVNSEKEKLVGTDSEGVGKSPEHLISPTWSDELKFSNFKMSKVISISLKDYGAILSGGFLANVAYWFDNKTGNWITSTYYDETQKTWVQDFNDKKFPDVYIGRKWDTFLPMKDYFASIYDDYPYEKGFYGQHTFPYDLSEIKQKKGDYSILKQTPYGNTYVKDFALFALVKENMGKDQYTDFLSISFSACGNISDIFGIRSVEVEDAYIRLDKDIEHLINSLEDIVGKENVLIYLTADRGSGDIPEMLEGMKMKSNYFDIQSSMVVLSSYLRILYGNKDWIETYYDGQIYLNRELIEDSKYSLSDFQKTTANFFVQFTGVSNAIAMSLIQEGDFKGDIMSKAKNSYNQKRSGDIFINLSPGWAMKPEKNRRNSLSARTSAYTENTHVPLIWYGWKIPQKNIFRATTPADIATTISFFLNINSSSMNTGEPIEEIIK